MCGTNLSDPYSLHYKIRMQDSHAVVLCCIPGWNAGTDKARNLKNYPSIPEWWKYSCTLSHLSIRKQEKDAEKVVGTHPRWEPSYNPSRYAHFE